MSSPIPLEAVHAPSPRPRPRAWRGLGHNLRAVAQLRRQAEIAVIERLNPSLSLETMPVAMLLVVLASLFTQRRH